MATSQNSFVTTNYLVPSNGTTQAVKFSGTFGTNYLIDWRNYVINNQNFQPQGLFADNTAGAVPLTITIMPIGYTITVGVGELWQGQFPAPNGQTAIVSGDPNNTATIIFVDFPVLPSNMAGTITNTVNVDLVGVAAGVRVPVDSNPMAAGNTLPFRDQEYVSAAESHQLLITGAAVTASVTPAIAQQNMRRFIATLSGDATLAAAGEDTLTVTLNAVVIFSRKLWLPGAAGNTLGGVTVADIDASMFGLPAGAGNLTVSLSSALATGSLDCNAYFTPQ